MLGVLRKYYNKLLPRRMGETVSVRSSRRFFHRVLPVQTRVRRFAVALHLGKRRLERAPPTITLWYLNVNNFRIFCTHVNNFRIFCTHCEHLPSTITATRHVVRGTRQQRLFLCKTQTYTMLSIKSPASCSKQKPPSVST